MNRRLLLALVVLATAFALASLAFAGTRQVLHDDEGDSLSDVDIVLAKADFAKGEPLVFTVKAAGTLPGGNNPCVELKRNPGGTGNRGGIYVGCFGDEITGGKFDGVQVKVKNGRKKNVFTVAADKIGDPRSVVWRGVSLEEDEPADAVPDDGYSHFPLIG
jgi:hypothetical protein